MSPKKRGALSLVLLSPALLVLSGCSGSNCDSNGSTLTKSDDCGTGTRRSGGGFIGGGLRGSGGFRGGGSSVESGSVRGGFGSSGHSFGSGGFGGGG